VSEKPAPNVSTDWGVSGASSGDVLASFTIAFISVVSRNLLSAALSATGSENGTSSFFENTENLKAGWSYIQMVENRIPENNVKGVSRKREIVDRGLKKPNPIVDSI
jgi:hypothetical protein